MNWYLEVLKKYAVFTGRARRKECWTFVLVSVIISFVLTIVAKVIGALSFLPNIYSLAVLVPSTAVGIRRLHDINKSGWWILIPILNIILMAQEGQKDDNQYGPNPKAVEA